MDIEENGNLVYTEISGESGSGSGTESGSGSGTESGSGSGTESGEALQNAADASSFSVGSGDFEESDAGETFATLGLADDGNLGNESSIDFQGAVINALIVVILGLGLIAGILFGKLASWR